VRKDSRARYILRDGQLRKFPLSFVETAGVAGRAAFARAGNHASALDLKTWGTKHLGPSAVDYLLTPFVRGIYGVQPQEVGVLAAFPSLMIPPGETLLGNLLRKKFAKGPKKSRSTGMLAPRLGMGHLVSKLEERLQQRLGERFIKGFAVTEIPAAPNVVVTVPAYKAAPLFASEFPQLADRLRLVEYTPLVSVTAFVKRASLTRDLRGVGVLLPVTEKRNSLGILFTSSSFAGRVVDESQYAAFTIMMGGSAKPAWVNASDEQIRVVVQRELSDIIGLREEPKELVINRWPQAIPRYSTSLPQVWQTARETWCVNPGRVLFGNYTGQVSMRGMIEAVATM
jgi:oxygen-dependent protoporphyrinogen oxidase